MNATRTFVMISLMGLALLSQAPSANAACVLSNTACANVTFPPDGACASVTTTTEIGDTVTCTTVTVRGACSFMESDLLTSIEPTCWFYNADGDFCLIYHGPDDFVVCL